jgi:hypothetical protein
MEEGGFAHPRSPHHRQGFPLGDVEIHPGEHGHLDAIILEGLDQTPDLDLWGSLRPAVLCHILFYRV